MHAGSPACISRGWPGADHGQLIPDGETAAVDDSLPETRGTRRGIGIAGQVPVSSGDQDDRLTERERRLHPLLALLPLERLEDLDFPLVEEERATEFGLPASEEGHSLNAPREHSIDTVPTLLPTHEVYHRRRKTFRPIHGARAGPAPRPPRHSRRAFSARCTGGRGAVEGAGNLAVRGGGLQVRADWCQQLGALEAVGGGERLEREATVASAAA